MQSAWTPAEKQIEEQERPRHVSAGRVLYTKFAVNEKKMVSRKLLVLRLPHSITALIFITCLLLPRKKTKKKKSAKNNNVRECIVDKIHAPLRYLPYFTNIITFDPHKVWRC